MVGICAFNVTFSIIFRLFQLTNYNDNIVCSISLTQDRRSRVDVDVTTQTWISIVPDGAPGDRSLDKDIDVCASKLGLAPNWTNI